MTSGDIARELRASRPAAPDALRDHVRTIVTAEPPARPAFGARLSALRPRGRRSALVLVPAAAMSIALAAGLVQLVRPEGNANIAAPATQADRGRAAVEPTDQGLETPSATAPSAAPEAYDNAFGAGASKGATAKSAPSASGLPAPAPDRAQRTSVMLALEVPDTDALSAATQEAIATTRALGGYLVSVQVGTSTSGAASIVAKVPSDRVQDAVARLSELGTITSQNVQIDDLQASLDDVNRRIGVLRNRIAAITARLQGTGLSTDERAGLEATRQALRDELAGNRRSGQAIRGEAAFATFSLELRTTAEEQAVPVAPSRIDRALDDMAGILAIEGIVLLYALVVLVPLGLALSLLWLAGRALGRRGRERLLSSTP